MVKKDKQPEPLYNDELNEEITQLMGPPPEEAAPNVASEVADEPRPVEPTGPPPVAKSSASELAKNVEPTTNKQSSENPNPAAENNPVAKGSAIGLDKLSENTNNDGQGSAGEPEKISDVAEEINKQLLAEQAKQATDAKPLKVVDNTASVVGPEDLDDKGLDDAVSDIIARESDELLAVEDVIRKSADPATKTKKTKTNIFRRWWQNKKLRYVTIAGLLAIMAAVLLVPTSRYAVLTVVGARASMNLKVIDTKSGLPIKIVQVSVAGKTSTSDAEGNVQLNNLKLGKAEMVLDKRSFAQKTQPVTIGWGSNPFNDPIQLEAAGSAYNFTITDWASGKPIEKAEVSDGDSKVLTDGSGKVSMLIQSNDKDVKFSVKADNYRVEDIVVGANDKSDKSLQLVVSNPDIFVSKRSGKYDVYKKDADGKNEVVLLGGSGSEQEGMSLLPNQSGTVAAVASTRDGRRDKDGFLLSNLYIIDTNTKTVVKIPETEAAQIQLVDWVRDKLIFVKVASGPSAATSGRQKGISYDYKQDKATLLASANYFNDVEVYKNQVYFAPSSTGGVAQLNRIDPDNSNKVVLLGQEVWELLRVKNDRLMVNAANKKWYEQQIGEAKFSEMATVSTSAQNRLYIDGPNGEKTVWIDQRDGKGVLILEDTKTGDSKTLLSKGGLTYPIRWLSNKHLLVRVSNSQETADYVLNIEGGEPKKISDVTNTAATNRWYYYR